MAAVRQMSVTQEVVGRDRSRDSRRRSSTSPRRQAETTVIVSEPSKSASQPSSFKVKLTRRDTSAKMGSDVTTTASSSRASVSDTEAKCVKSKPHKAAGWKTSKFFSKTMSSAELLRGLKKLSVTSTASGGPDDQDGKSSSSGKVKFSMKKRNSSSDSAVNKDRSPEGFHSGEGSRKSSRESSDGSPNVSPRTSIDEGIVCKKEDILSLIHHKTKKKPQSSTSVASTSPKKMSLRNTRSATIDPSGMTADEQQMDNNLPKIVSTPPILRRGSTTLERSTSEETKPTKSKRNSVPGRSSSQKTLDEAATKSIEPVQDTKDKKTRRKEGDKLPEPPAVPTDDDPESQVKWDEGNIVDAMLLGDAIEAFLRGSMGGSPIAPATPKRVSFKKT